MDPFQFEEPIFDSKVISNLYRSPYNTGLNQSLESKKTIPLVNLMNQINLLEVKRKEFMRLKTAYRELNPEEIYLKKTEFPFEIAFSQEYVIPQNWDNEKWKGAINQLNNYPLLKIELMDLYLYHNRAFIDFEILENLCLYLLKIYGINWAERYLNQYIDYLIWYNDRIENIKIFEVIQDYELIQNTFSFFRYIIKAIICWEYRKRTKVIENTNLATNYYKIIKSNNLLIFEIKIFQKYESTLKNLQKII